MRWLAGSNLSSHCTQHRNGESTKRDWKSAMKPLNLRRLATLMLLSMIGLISLPHDAQAAPNASGDYSGTLGSLRLELHIVVAADGTLIGTLDSPTQSALGIPCSDFRLDGDKLSFK